MKQTVVIWQKIAQFRVLHLNNYVPGLKRTIAFKYAYSYPSRQSLTMLLQNSCNLKICSITSFPLSVGSLSKSTHTQNIKPPSQHTCKNCGHTAFLKIMICIRFKQWEIYASYKLTCLVWIILTPTIMDYNNLFFLTFFPPHIVQLGLFLPLKLP